MPLYLPGSVVVGPQSTGTSAPSSLTAYLTSIGKASWYGGYLAGVNMFTASAGGGSAVTTNGESVGSWLPYKSTGGWNSRFDQSNSSKRPVYGTNRNGKPGVYGNATDWFLVLNSSTALNQPYTLLLSAWVTCAAGSPRLYSHNNQAMAFYCPTTMGLQPQVNASSSKRDTNANHVFQASPVDASTVSYRMGWSSAPGSTQHYNNAPYLLSSSAGTSYTDSTIYELWFVPWLTPAEISDALRFLA